MKIRTERLRTRDRLLLSAVAILPLLGIAHTARAQQASEGVETITVTAEKRAENVQSVAASITAFGGDQLEQENITNFADLARMTPNLQFYTANNTRNTIISIRNQGTSGTNPGFDPDVGLFLDGVYVPAAGPILNDLVDISTVEVLRGPQGTLYGRNTPVGDINITTRAPTQDTEGMIEGEIGNYDERKVTGYFGGGITDDLAGRITAWSDTHSGYTKDLSSGTMVNDNDTYGVRGRLRWTPDAETTVDLIGYFNEIQTHGIFPTQIDPFGEGGIVGLIGAPNSSYGKNSTYNFVQAWNAMYPATPYAPTGKFQTDDANPGDLDENEMYGFSAAVSRVLPFGATLTNTSAYNFVNDDIKNLSANGLPVSLTSVAVQPNRYSSISDELRIVSPGKQFIDYVGGVYFYHEDMIYNNIQTFGPGANIAVAGHTITPGQSSQLFYKQNATDIAPYAQATANLLDDFRITGGIRYSVDHKDAGYNGFNTQPNGSVCTNAMTSCFIMQNVVNPQQAFQKSRDDHAVNWLLTAQYDVAQGIMLYYTMANGFKDGGFNTRASNPSNPLVEVNPEHTLNYELGTHSIFFDNKVLVNLDVYRMIIDGRQVSELAPNSSILFNAFNAGIIHQNGVEMDTQIHPIDPLSITGDFAYANSQFASFPNAPCVANFPFKGAAPPPGSPQINPTFGNLCNQTGFTPSGSPKWAWSLQAHWEQPWMDSHFEWFVSGAVHFTGGQYLDASLDPRSYQPGYTLFDANLGFEPEAGNWRVQLYGRNLSNVAYFTSAAALGGGGLYNINGQAPNGFMGWYGPPRTFGIEGSYKF
jgi:iron complex outermembrane receptor protein